MRIRSFPGRGFTLTEIMIAVVIFGLVVAGIVSLNMTAFKSQVKALYATALGNQGTLLRRAVTVAVQSATDVQSPPLGGVPSTALTAWQNRDPDSTQTPPALVDPTEASVSFSHICLDGANQKIYLYKGVYPTNPAGITCGNDAAGAAKTLLVGGSFLSIPADASAPCQFSRLRANLVRLQCTMIMDVGYLNFTKRADIDMQIATRQSCQE